MHAQLLASSHAHRGMELRTGGRLNPAEVMGHGHWSSEESYDDNNESRSMEKWQKWDNNSMESVENQETAL